MADNEALAILNRRLASGEITPDQYDELAARLGAGRPDKSVADPPPVVTHEPKTGKSHFSKYWWIYACVIGGVVSVSAFRQSQWEKGLEIGEKQCIADGYPSHVCSCLKNNALRGPVPSSQEEVARLTRQYTEQCK